MTGKLTRLVIAMVVMTILGMSVDFKIYKRTIEGEPMIFAYNKEQVGDVLLVILEDTKDIKRSVERKGKVARVTADETGKTLAWNIFEASSLIDIEGNGQVFLSDQDVAVLNEELAKEGLKSVWKTHKVQSLWLDKLMKWLHIQTVTTLTSAK